MDCLVAAVLRFHSELSKAPVSEVVDESSDDQKLEHLILTSVLSCPQDVHEVLLGNPFLLDDAYVHKVRRLLNPASLKVLLDCAPLGNGISMTEQNAAVPYLSSIYMLTASLSDIYHRDESLQLALSSSSNNSLHQGIGPRYILLNLLNHMTTLLFFIKLDPNSHLATICFGILKRSLHTMVSGQGIDVFLPSDGQLVIDTMNQANLVTLALYSKGGLKFLFALIPLLESMHQRTFITQIATAIQVSPKFLLSRKLSLLSRICKAAACKPHVYTAYLQSDGLISLQNDAINAIFAMLDRIEEYETFIWALKRSLSCLKEIIFSRVSPVHISRASGSLRTMYRSRGFMYALERLDILLSKEGIGLHELSLALSFYVDCAQRFTNLRYNLFVYQASSSKGRNIVVKSDINVRLLHDKLESTLISILKKYFTIVTSLDTLDSEFLVCTLTNILRWTPVAVDAAFNLLLDLVRDNIKKQITADVETAFLLHLMLLFYQVCLAISIPAQSPWLDQAEARCIRTLIYVALPFVYEECIPFLQALFPTLLPEDIPIFQKVLLGFLEMPPIVLRSVTRELLHPLASDSSLHLTCKTIYNDYFTAAAETLSAPADKLLSNFFSISWISRSYPSIVQQQLFKLLCDNLITFVEFAYVPTLHIKEGLSNNIFLAVYTRATRSAISYGNPCLEIVLLCMLFQYITLGHFSNREHQIIAFWKASASLEVLRLLQNIFNDISAASGDLAISLQNVSALVLLLIGEMLKMHTLLEETPHKGQSEHHARRYDSDLQVLVAKVMTSVLSDKASRLDLIHQCLTFLCASSASCYILPGSLFQCAPSFLLISPNKYSQQEVFKTIRQSSHSYQAERWRKLVSRGFTVFQSVSYELLLLDPITLHADISVSLLFLSTPSLVLWQASSHRSLRFTTKILDYLHDLSTENKSYFSRRNLNLFIRSCILSGEQHTLRTIADFIVKANILPTFFSAADEDSPLDVSLLAILLKQSDSLIVHNAIARYLLKYLGSELPCAYLLTERQEAPADEDGMLRFLSYLRMLFQMQVYPLLEQSFNHAILALQAGTIIPGNSLLLRSRSSPLKRARKTFSLSSLTFTVFTYCYIKNSYTMTLTLTVSGSAGDVTRLQPEVITLTIWIQDASVFFSTNATVSSSKYSVPLAERAEWIYVEAAFSSSNLALLCYTTLSDTNSLVASIPLSISIASPLEAQLDVDAAIRVLYLSDDALNAVSSVAASCTSRIYPIAVYAQPQNDQQHFQRSQAPTFTWTYAETIGYSFVLYDAIGETELVRAIAPQDVWHYDINGLFQAFSLLFLGESDHGGKTPRYKQEFEPALLMKLLHMLQDPGTEELFGQSCGYKLLIAYFSTLQWPMRMQALHVVVVFTKLLLEFILQFKRETYPHLFLLLMKLYHELIVVPITLYLPDTGFPREIDKASGLSCTAAEQSFYMNICQLHHKVFSEGYYLLRGAGERTTPICFIMYQLFLFCRLSDDIARSVETDPCNRPLEQFVTLIQSYAKDNNLHTNMLIQLLKCMSLPFPIMTLSSDKTLVMLLHNLYTNAIQEEAYSVIKAAPVVADLYLYEKMLLLPLVLSLDDTSVSSTLTRLMWKEWAPGQSAFHELLIDIKQLLESTDFSSPEEPGPKSFTTICNVADFFAFVLFNLLIKGEYDRFEKVLVTYAVLPLVAEDSITYPASLASLKYILGLRGSLYEDYIPIAAGLVALATLALFAQVSADLLAISNLDEGNRNYSALDGSVSLLIRLFDMMSLFLEQSVAANPYTPITLSILSAICAFSKEDKNPAEFLQQLVTKLSSTDTLAALLRSAPLSLICTCLNTYSKAAAEQLHQKLDVLRTSASIDVLPFSANGNSARWSPYLPDELCFCPIGSLFTNVPGMKAIKLEGEVSEHYVCPGCMSTVSLQGPSLEMTRLIYGNTCIICSYAPKYKLSKATATAFIDSFGVFSGIVHFEMMNVSLDRRFSLDDQKRVESRSKGDPKTKLDSRPNLSVDSSTALHLFYQKYLYSRESTVAHFLLPHPIYKPMHHLSSQRLVLLSPSTFSYPSVRLSPAVVHSDVNSRLQDSCLTDIGGALPPLSSTSLRQYSITNNKADRRLIEFGDVLVVSLLYTGCGVLSLRVSSDLSDKTEKQAPPIGEQIIIMDKHREKMSFSVADTEPSFVACTGQQNQTFLFNWARFDQRSDSDEDSIGGSLQAADETTNSAIKERQEAESFSILRRLLCTKDNPRSIHLESSFSTKQDSFGRRISYGLYDYCMSNGNKNYHKYKDVELSIEFSRILYMIPLFFIRMQPALQILESSGAVYVLLFKTQEHAVKLIHSYGYYRRFGSGEPGGGSAYGTYYYYTKSLYKKKGVLLDFETIISTFQADLLMHLRSLLSRRVSLLMANNAISLTAVHFSVFTLLSTMNLLAARSPVVSYIYSIFPALSPRKSSKVRNLKYPLPAQSTTALCKSITKYAEMSLSELQGASSQESVAATTFLNDILKQSTQMLEKAITASSDDAIAFFRKSLEKANLSSSAIKLLSTNPLFRTFVSNNMTLPYYCFCVEPFTSLQRSLQSGCLDAFSRLFIGLRSHWEKVELGSSFHEAIPELFYSPYIFTNTNGLQLASDAETITEALQSTPSQAIDVTYAQRIALESTIFSNQLSQAGLRSWIELLFGSKQQSLDALNLFPSSTVECYPGEANIATSLYFGTYPMRLHQDELSKLLSLMDNANKPAKVVEELVLTHSVDIRKHLHAVPFEQLTPGSVQSIDGECELVFQHFNQPALCVAGRHITPANYITGMLWTTEDCTIMDAHMLYFDVNRQEISVFELSKAFIDSFHGVSKGGGTNSLFSIPTGGNLGRDQDSGGLNTPEQLVVGAQYPLAGHIVILGFSHVSGLRPYLLTNAPVAQLAKQGKTVGMHVATFKLASSLSRRYPTSKNVVVSRIDSAGYMPFYGHVIHLYTNQGIILANIRDLFANAQPQLFIIQHCPLDVGYYDRLITATFLHVPELSLICYYSSHILHVLEYNSLHRAVSYGSRETDSPYLLTKFIISYEEKLSITYCAVHERQGLIAVGLSVLDNDSAANSDKALRYCIYLYTLGNIHIKALDMPLPVQHIAFFGGYDDGFAGYMLVNKRYIYSLDSNASQYVKKVCETEILADSLAVVDGAIVGYQGETFRWYS